MKRALLRQRVEASGLAFVFWTLLAVSFAASSLVSALSEGEQVSWVRQIAWQLSNFYLWWALTPLVAWLGRKGARDWRRFWFIHLPSSIIVAFAETGATLSIFWTLCGAGRLPVTSFGGFVRLEIFGTFHLALLTYWLLLVVLRGMESQRSLKDERLRTSMLETQLAQAQLQALRMQLQPHFLFNSLNAISALALADPSQSRQMIARLSDFLRLTLEGNHAPQVPLSRELQFLECYLGIQRVRFQDRLTTEMDVATETVNAAVPNMILQPLVENALRHGLLAKPGCGTLRISTRREGEDLRICVDDDGLGLPDAGPLEGIGLGNTRTRLKMLFGEWGRLSLLSMPQGGTRAELRFPFREFAS